MHDVLISPATFDQALALLIQRRPVHENGYFKSLRDGSMDKAGFQRSQAQFYFAVRFFARPMAALAARLPDSTGRMSLIHNLGEEHGGQHPEKAHDRTFIQFLASTGFTDISQVTEGAEVRAFNLALLGACAMAEPELAFACLGAIEYTFAGISAEIGQTVQDRGWVDAGSRFHYTVHAELDQEHAREFFAEIEPAWRLGGERRRVIEDGLELGLYLFDRLYTDLHQIAARST